MYARFSAVRCERKSLQVRNHDTGGVPCLHLSKSTGNVWLPLTMGGDCSRWYLKEKKRGRESETESVLFFLFPLSCRTVAHDSKEHV